MDLRRRLIGSLALLLGSLMTIATLIQLYSLKSDIETEFGASARLVGVLLEAGNARAGDNPRLAERLAEAKIRHLSIRAPGQPPAASEAHPLLSWLGVAPRVPLEQEIRIGDQTLYIAANPNSEIDERLGDAVRIWTTLLLFFGATLLVVWWSADRALRPVRELEDGLHRLARGESNPALPAFALFEFRRVAGAIEHLARSLADSRSAQQALARQLITLQEDERRALARELHDEMGQTLTALSATATHLERNVQRLDASTIAECASDLRRDIRTTGDQLRTILKSLRPHGLEASSLADTLRELIDGWRGRGTGIEFVLELPGRFPPLQGATTLAVYRVVQEAVTNVIRHSSAQRCAIRISVPDEQLQLEVIDDGCGLPASGAERKGGLLGMRERLEMAGGQLELRDSAGGGVHLIALLPAPRTRKLILALEQAVPA